MSEELDYGINKDEYIATLSGNTKAKRLAQFKNQYWITVGSGNKLDATFNVSGFPTALYASDMGTNYEGTISYLEGNSIPSDAEIKSAYIVFSRPTRGSGAEAGSSFMLTLSASGASFSVDIPLAHGDEEGTGKNLRVNITDSKRLDAIATMLQSGKGTKITGSVWMFGSKSGESSPVLRFRSSAPYGQASNAKKFHLHFTYWYDPASRYAQSSMRFDNYKAIACDVTDTENIKDANCFNAHIIPYKYDTHVFHKVHWYTKNADGSDLNYLDKNGDMQTARFDDRIMYKDGSSDLDLRFPVPDEWCNGWPNSDTGQAYFELETWYRYSNPSTGAFAEVPPVMKLGDDYKQNNLIVTVPAYAKPTVSLATMSISPVDLPWTSEVNQKSEDWIERGAYVAGYCNVDLEVEKADGIFGSTIDSYTFIEDTYGRWQKHLTRNQTANTLETKASFPRVSMPGDLAFIVYARDSRNRLSDPVYFTMKEGYYHVDINQLTEDGDYALDDNGNQITHQGVRILSYATPSIDYCSATRANDNADISETGTNLIVEAAPLHSSIPDITTGVDINSPSVYFDYSSDKSNWFPRNDLPSGEYEQTPINITGAQAYFYNETTFYVAITTYIVRFLVYDAMTAFLQQELGQWLEDPDHYAEWIEKNGGPPDPFSYAYMQTQNLGDGQCTVCLKRDGLGISIGMMPKTDRNLRCIEISENWDIRHSGSNGQFYYIPDVVFTSANDPYPPRKRKGRIWLKEI